MDACYSNLVRAVFFQDTDHNSFKEDIMWTVQRAYRKKRGANKKHTVC